MAIDQDNIAVVCLGQQPLLHVWKLPGLIDSIGRGIFFMVYLSYLQRGATFLILVGFHG